MAEEQKSFWTTLPGIITGIAAIVTAVTGLIVALNGAGIFSKPPAAAPENGSSTQVKAEVKKDTDSTTNKPKELQQPAVKFRAIFSMTAVKIEDHKYQIISSSVEAITPQSNSLKIEIKYKNNSNYSPATFWNEGFRLAIDGALTPPSGELSQLVERHAELTGTVTFEVPNNAKKLVFHIIDGDKDVAIPIKLVSG